LGSNNWIAEGFFGFSGSGCEVLADLDSKGLLRRFGARFAEVWRGFMKFYVVFGIRPALEDMNIVRAGDFARGCAPDPAPGKVFRK
jgi:hypothetical protein